MPKKSLYFTKVLRCKWLKSLAIYRIKVREFWSCMSAYYVNFQFSHAYIRPFCPTNYKKITKHFQCGYKTKTRLKHRTHYAIFQNRRICASCLIMWLSALCGLCIFAHIYTACGLRLLVWLVRMFIRSWLVWAFMV